MRADGTRNVSWRDWSTESSLFIKWLLSNNALLYDFYDIRSSRLIIPAVMEGREIMIHPYKKASKKELHMYISWWWAIIFSEYKQRNQNESLQPSINRTKTRKRINTRKETNKKRIASNVKSACEQPNADNRYNKHCKHGKEATGMITDLWTPTRLLRSHSVHMRTYTCLEYILYVRQLIDKSCVCRHPIFWRRSHRHGN